MKEPKQSTATTAVYLGSASLVVQRATAFVPHVRANSAGHSPAMIVRPSLDRAKDKLETPPSFPMQQESTQIQSNVILEVTERSMLRHFFRMILATEVI